MPDIAVVLDKVRKLIALASSPYEEEARSAAFRAATLIREHNLQISEPKPVLRPSPSPPVYEPFVDPLREQKPRWLRPFQAKFPGRCLECRQAIFVGDWIYWEKGVGSYHEHCY